MAKRGDKAVDLNRENAELRRQLDESLAQQQALGEVLQVINSSPGDLAPVFDAILEKAMALCSAATGVMTVRDGEQFRTIAARGVPAAFVEFRKQNPVPPGQGGIAGRIRSGDPFVHIVDLKDDDLYRSGQPQRRAMVDLAGARTWLAVGLKKDEEVLGAIDIFRRKVRPFSDQEIALLQNFAAQAVIAMENARLITETREALDQQTATAEVLGIISASPGRLEPVFDAILANAVRICGGAFGILALREGEGFRGVAVDRVGGEFAQTLSRLHNPPPGTGLDRLQQTARTIHIADCAADAAYDPVRALNPGFARVRAALHVPMLKEGTLLGAILIYRDQVILFDDKEIALVEGFAAQAVIAMENARLLTETREALDQQTATAEVLQVINSSPGDLAPVFDAMLDKALALCGASFGNMWVFGGTRERSVAVRGAPDFAQWLSERGAVEPAPGSLADRVRRGEHVVHIIDAAQEAAYGSSPTRRAAVEIGGYRTLLCVALRKDDAPLGGIVVYRREEQPFTDKQIALLQNFAAQAVIAMENARLLGELRARTDEVAGLNRDLEARVAAQLAELERTGKLRRFLAPQLAELIVAQGDESILESHRREIVVVFCDLRGFTAFAERAEPEEVMALLHDYHAALGPIVAAFEGTLDHYAGDEIMVFFNDPVPTPDPARRAIDMAVAMRAAAQALLQAWRRHGHDIGFGVGISQGYATLGQIGFAERMDYTAIGTVTNLAARLCSEAKDGQILVSRRVAIAVEDAATLEEIGDLSLKGLSQAVAVYNVAVA